MRIDFDLPEAGFIEGMFSFLIGKKKYYNELEYQRYSRYKKKESHI